jgi:hypothetical protein
MTSSKKIDITVSSGWCRTVAAQLRRCTPATHETDEWIAETVHWLELLAEKAENNGQRNR